MLVAPFKHMTVLDSHPSIRLGAAEVERQANLLRVPREVPPRPPAEVLPGQMSGNGKPR